MLELRRLYEADANEESNRRMAAVIRRTVRLSRRLLIPTTPRRPETLLWILFRWRPFNPVRRATEQDLFTLLDFFWRCRMEPSGHIRLPTKMGNARGLT